MIHHDLNLVQRVCATKSMRTSKIWVDTEVEYERVLAS